MSNLKAAVEARFSLILLLSCLAGLLLPGADRIPAGFVTIALAFITFLSFFRASRQEVRGISVPGLVLFYLARFLVFPVILLLPSTFLLPAYADSIFLLALLPAGVMSASISMMFSGNVVINFFIFIASTLLAPLTLPALFASFGDGALQVDTIDFFRSLLVLLVLPFLLHLPARRVASINDLVKQYGGTVSTIAVALIIIAVVGRERTVIFGDPAIVVESVVISLLVYLLLYAGGWVLALRSRREDKIAFSVASGVNQLGLGISLAFLYFPSTTSIFMVSSNLAWVAGIALAKWRIGSGHARNDEEGA